MQWLADGHSGQVDASRLAVIVAHPDDETIGCGGILSLLDRAAVIVVTNGAPTNCETASRFGFSTPRSYADARSRELRAALAIANVAASQIIELGVHDGAVWQNLPAICRQLTGIFVERQIETAITHAFEGGHSDHDGVAVCVHQTARNLARGRADIVEMPLYHAGQDGTVRQMFCDGDEGVIVALDAPMLRRKTRMFRAYQSQTETLANFDIATERFRSARVYDFQRPPNGGRLKYELSHIGPFAGDWGARVRHAAADANRAGRLLAHISPQSEHPN